MREWLSGGASPCQGEGRGFDPRFALFVFCGNAGIGRQARLRILCEFHVGVQVPFPALKYKFDLGVDMLKTVIMIIFLIVCIALSGIILLQEGKSAGLGSIAGMGDSYWSKARGRSIEGHLSKITTVLAVSFLVLALVLNIVW